MRQETEVCPLILYFLTLAHILKIVGKKTPPKYEEKQGIPLKGNRSSETY